MRESEAGGREHVLRRSDSGAGRAQNERGRGGVGGWCRGRCCGLRAPRNAGGGVGILLQSLNEQRPPGAAMQRMGAAEMRHARAEAERNGRLAQRENGSVHSPVVLRRCCGRAGGRWSTSAGVRPSFAAADVSDWCSHCERTQIAGQESVHHRFLLQYLPQSTQSHSQIDTIICSLSDLLPWSSLFPALVRVAPSCDRDHVAGPSA